ncbi:hypothetical protein Avbf_11880 [Armadillidium vulgare]|nr:hypothetical protein Avbf_11880 [Armadillidium vulgare]
MIFYILDIVGCNHNFDWSFATNRILEYMQRNFEYNNKSYLDVVLFAFVLKNNRRPVQARRVNEEYFPFPGINFL